jgi:hypothetical protein
MNIGMVDDNLQAEPGWASHIPSDGSGIDNPAICPDPTNLVNGILEPGVLDPNNNSRYFQVEGLALSTGEFYLKRPIQVGLQPTLTLNFMPDADDVANAALMEHDVMLWFPNPKPTENAPGLLANLSCEVYGPTGKILVGQGAGGWADTGLTIGSYYSLEEHEVEFEYSINWTNYLFGVKQLTIDGKPFVPPTSLQSQSMVPTSWTGSNLFLQFQKQLKQAGRAGFWLNKAKINWD